MESTEKWVKANLLHIIPVTFAILFFIIGQLTGWPLAPKIASLGLLGLGISLFIPTKKSEEQGQRPVRARSPRATGKKRGNGKTIVIVVVAVLVLVVSIMVLSPDEGAAVPDIEGTQTAVLESGPGGSEEIAEFTIPPLFFAILVGVLVAWVSSYIVKARVHFIDPPAYATRDDQGRQVYVDFSFTWQIESISRWLLVAMTRTDIASRLKTEIHAAMAAAMSYSCEEADRLRKRLARLVAKTVSSSVVSRYGITCQVTIEHFRLEEGIQQQIDAAMTQLLTEGSLGMGDRRYICNLLGLDEGKLDLSDPQVAEAVIQIINEKIRGEYQRDSATSLGTAIGSALGAIGRREQ